MMQKRTAHCADIRLVCHVGTWVRISLAHFAKNENTPFGVFYFWRSVSIRIRTRIHICMQYLRMYLSSEYHSKFSHIFIVLFVMIADRPSPLCLIPLTHFLFHHMLLCLRYLLNLHISLRFYSFLLSY